MRYKLFVYILFKNMRIILLYLFLLFMAVYLELAQLDIYLNQSEAVELSDNVIMENIKQDNIKNAGHKINTEKGDRPLRNLAAAALIILLVLISLVLYIIRGMGKKVGTLKALGITNAYIISTFCAGFGLFIAAVCTADVVLSFLTLNIPSMLVFKYLIIIGAVMFLIPVISFIITCQKVLPGGHRNKF